jgi:hypothetical protein
MMHTIVKIVVAAVFASQLLFSQTAPLNLSASSTPTLAYAEVPPLKKQVTEVSLTISVTDRKGHFIQGLGRNDFTILDNARHQTAITFFQNQTGLPLDIALVMDVSASMTARYELKKKPSTIFCEPLCDPEIQASCLRSTRRYEPRSRLLIKDESFHGDCRNSRPMATRLYTTPSIPQLSGWGRIRDWHVGSWFS